MLGQPVSMLIPQVVGFKLTGELPEGSTATDLVLTVTQMLRERGVVGKFVEFHGEGLAKLPLAVVELNLPKNRLQDIRQVAPYFPATLEQTKRFNFVSVDHSGRIEALAERPRAIEPAREPPREPRQPERDRGRDRDIER